LLNVGVAFALGKFAIRYVFHRAPLCKAWGLLGIVLATGCMLAIGLVIAHFRDSLMSTSADPTRDAFASLIAAPWALHVLMSFLLLAISIGFAIAAALDGVFSGERYPGYAKVSKAAVEARAACE